MALHGPQPMAAGRKAAPESLRSKVVRGGIWVFALRIANRGLGFVRTVVLARLLAPEDFGLLGIALLSVATLETFSQTGFQTALIQKKDDIASHLDTAWTVSILRGLALFLILFVFAPAIAGFFSAPEATGIVRIIALSTLIAGFKNIGVVFFQKELEFRRSFLYEFSATFSNFAVSLGLAFVLRDVWALVCGALASNLVMLILSYRLHPYRPRIRIDKDKLGDLLGFGKWVLGSSILVFLNSQGDDIFVGRVLGVAALGYYQMAYLFSNLPATEITHMVSRVTLPAYAKLQDEPGKLGQAYLQVLKLTAFISVPLAGALFILARDFTALFMGEKWLPMVPALQVLVFWGLLRSLVATTGPLFYGLGRPDLAAKLQLMQLGFMVVLIYPLSTQMGIPGTALAVVLAAFPPNMLAFHLVLRLLRCGAVSFLKGVAVPLAASAAAVLSLSALKTGPLWAAGWAGFLQSLVLYLVCYLAVIALCERFLDYQLVAMIKDLRKGAGL